MTELVNTSRKYAVQVKHFIGWVLFFDYFDEYINAADNYKIAKKSFPNCKVRITEIETIERVIIASV